MYFAQKKEEDLKDVQLWDNLMEEYSMEFKMYWCN